MRQGLTRLFPKTIFGRTILAIILGIFTGLFFGDKTAYLKPIGTIYITLMQVVLYPFIISTLLLGLGKLSPTRAFLLLKRGWIYFVAYLAIIFTIIGILTLAIPISPGLETGITPTPSNHNLIDLLLSNNVFAALAQNQIPAVIIFCLILAIMLQRMKNTQTLFQILEVISNACLEFWRNLVKLAPVSIFSLIAYFSGTMKLAQLTETSLFLFLFFVGSLMLIFWVLPIMITSLMPIKYRYLIKSMREALIIAGTTSTVLSIPYIQTLAINLLKTKDPKTNEVVEEVIDTNLILSYSFATGGPLFAYLFISFATLYFNHPLEQYQKIWLPILTFFSAMGGQLSAIIYLSDWLHLPKETSTLYLSINPIVQFTLNMVSAMSITLLTLVITAAYFRKLEFKQWRLILNFIGIFLVLLLAIQVKHIVPDPVTNTFNRLMSAQLNSQMIGNVQTKFVPLDEENLKPSTEKEDTLFRIQRTNILRVGYNASLPPFSYLNNNNELVGFDVAYMYALAQDLEANIVFIPFTLNYLAQDMQANAFDIAIGGIFVTEANLSQVAFSDSYFSTFPSFIVPANRRKEFSSQDSIEKIDDLKIGVLEGSQLISIARNAFPKARIAVLPSMDAFEEAFRQKRIDAVFWIAVRSQIWVLGHPHYVSVSTPDIVAPFLMSYMVQRSSPQFLSFLNYWLKLKENEGFREKMYNYWILIRPIPDTSPRWSILNNVLGFGNKRSSHE